MKIKKQLDERQRLIGYKYGFQAFWLLLFEVVIIDILFLSIDPNIDFVNIFFNHIGIVNLLILITIPPLGYFILRSLISGCINTESRWLYYVYAPLFTVLYLINSNNLKMLIPLLILFWSAFFINVYHLCKTNIKKE